jgi:mono/diheme cytochrome c family protein
MRFLRRHIHASLSGLKPINGKQDIMNQQRSVAAWLLVIWIFFSGNINADEPSLTLRKTNTIIKTLGVNELMQLKDSATSLTVDNPTDSKVKIYQGILLTALLEQVFGSNWQQFNAVKFSSQDGYQPVIPSANITAHTGMVATGEHGRHGFSLLPRKNGEAIDPGAFFLVWENINDTNAKKDAWLSWPWQLVGIELTSLEREYPHSAPPETASEAVNQGFLAFRQHCIKCHAINGDGGDVGPELNYPVNVTEYWQPTWLARFIANPQSIRANSKMLSFYRDVENRPVLIESIIAYLKSMVSKKIPVSLPQSKKR